jgi:hypothetical protein
MVMDGKVTLLGSGVQNGGNFHLRLNIRERSIENKYREGTLKSTSKGGSKYLKSQREKQLPGSR